MTLRAGDERSPLAPTVAAERRMATVQRRPHWLPRDAMTVIHLRYGGMAYREIARRMGVEAAAVEMHHKRVLERIPDLKELFPAKTRKRAARRRLGGKGVDGE